MKRALSVAMVTALTLLTLLFVAHAQEVSDSSVSPLLQQELAAMQSAFGGVQNFMSQLVTEVKTNMSDIDTFSAKVRDLSDVVAAISVEIKQDEGKLLGLRSDADALKTGQDRLTARADAAESGLSDVKSAVDLHGKTISTLQTNLEALTDTFGVHMADYADFTTQVASSFDGLRTEIYAGMDGLQSGLSGRIDELQWKFNDSLTTMESSFTSDTTMLESEYGDLASRVKALEDEDVGTFKKKVLDLERSIAALAIKVDNNRAKLEGFDQAIASLSADMATTKDGIMQANKELLGQYDARLQAVEDNATQVKTQIDTLYFISIVGLLAGVGALIWGFLGAS
jgi:chromosome segregation ATPase